MAVSQGANARLMTDDHLSVLGAIHKDFTFTLLAQRQAPSQLTQQVSAVYTVR